MTGTQVGTGRGKADPTTMRSRTAQHTVGTAADKPASTVRAVIAAECFPHPQATQPVTSDSHSLPNANQPGDKTQRIGVPGCATSKARRSLLSTLRLGSAPLSLSVASPPPSLVPLSTGLSLSTCLSVGRFSVSLPSFYASAFSVLFGSQASLQASA